MENIKVTQLDGGKFTIKMESTYFQKKDIVQINSMTCVVVKVRKFNWWRRLLFDLGFKFYSMDLKQINRYSKGWEEYK